MTARKIRINPFPSRPSNREIIVILGLLTAIGPLSIDSYLPSIPAIANEFGAGVALVQQSVSAYFFGLAIGQIICGPLSDRYGRKIVLLIGLAFYLVSTLICIRASTVDSLIIARTVQGLGASATAAAGRAIIRDIWSGNRAARALSFVMIVMAFGPLAAPFIGSQMFEYLGWRPIFWLMFGYGALLVALVVFRLPETNGPEKRIGVRVAATFRAYGHILSGARAWGYLICGGMSYATMFAYIIAASSVYIGFFSISPTIFPFFFALNALGLTVGNGLNSRYVARYGYRVLLGVGMFVTLVATLALVGFALTTLGGFIAVVVALFVAVLPISMVGANAMTGLLNLYPRNAGAAAALFGVAQFGIGGVAGVLTKLFATSPPRAMALAMAVMAIGSAVGWGVLYACGELHAIRRAGEG